jgi:hypothetical protein
MVVGCDSLREPIISNIFDNNIIQFVRLFAPYEEWQMKKAQKAP